MKVPPMLIIALSALSLSACSTVVDVNLAIEGMPAKSYLGSSTVTTKFMPRSEVSSHCSHKLNAASKITKWYNACVYKKSGGEIVMIMPTPGSLDPATYAKLLEHEYQHVGQAMQGEKLGHQDWQ